MQIDRLSSLAQSSEHQVIIDDTPTRGASAAAMAKEQAPSCASSGRVRKLRQRSWRDRVMAMAWKRPCEGLCRQGHLLNSKFSSQWLARGVLSLGYVVLQHLRRVRGRHWTLTAVPPPRAVYCSDTCPLASTSAWKPQPRTS